MKNAIYCLWATTVLTVLAAGVAEWLGKDTKFLNNTATALLSASLTATQVQSSSREPKAPNFKE